MVLLIYTKVKPFFFLKFSSFRGVAGDNVVDLRIRVILCDNSFSDFDSLNLLLSLNKLPSPPDPLSRSIGRGGVEEGD